MKVISENIFDILKLDKKPVEQNANFMVSSSLSYYSRLKDFNSKLEIKYFL